MSEKQLRVEDRLAVDLLLERANGFGEKALVDMVFSAPSESHLQSADRLLSLLDAYPASDPPVDLVARTLSRIEAAKVDPSARPQPQALTQNDVREQA